MEGKEEGNYGHDRSFHSQGILTDSIAHSSLGKPSPVITFALSLIIVNR